MRTEQEDVKKQRITVELACLRKAGDSVLARIRIKFGDGEWWDLNDGRDFIPTYETTYTWEVDHHGD